MSDQTSGEQAKWTMPRSGWTCDACGQWISAYITGGHICTGQIAPVPPAVGWICPKCGAGNAPISMRCACVPLCVVTLDGDLGTR